MEDMKSLLHLIRFYLGFDQPFSQVTSRELEMLVHYSRDAKVICEIGCYEGKTAVALAQNSQGKVYSVDPFFKGRLQICYGECIARLHRRRSRVTNLHFLMGLSQEVAPSFHLPIDFLFIDADHTYQAIKQDWKSWYPKVASGGVVALHDSRIAVNSPIPVGTMKFYAEDVPRVAGVAEVYGVDSLVVLRKAKPDLN